MNAKSEPSESFLLSYEVEPSRSLDAPPGMRAAPFAVRSAALRAVVDLFEEPLLRKLGLKRARRNRIALGGWEGTTNPSGHLMLSDDATAADARVLAAAIGFVWRQDAVAVSRLHPGGRGSAGLVRRADGRPYTPRQADRHYRRLYRAASLRERAAVQGFAFALGGLLFIGPPGLTEQRFKRSLRRLVRRELPGEFTLQWYRADFELVSCDWDNGDGEDYLRICRAAGRPALHLAEWLARDARPRAEAFLASIDWQGQGQGQAGDASP